MEYPSEGEAGRGMRSQSLRKADSEHLPLTAGASSALSSHCSEEGVVESETGAKRTNPINPNYGKALYEEDDY